MAFSYKYLRAGTLKPTNKKVESSPAQRKSCEYRYKSINMITLKSDLFREISLKNRQSSPRTKKFKIEEDLNLTVFRDLV